MPKNPNKPLFIDLPEKTKDVFISFIFSYGYFNESNTSFGTAHVLEHYIVDKIRNSLGIRFVNGSIGDTSTIFTIETTKKDFIRHFSEITNLLLQEKFDDPKLLDKEKNRINIELLEKYEDFYGWLRQETISSLFSRPKEQIRRRISQVSIVKNIKPKNLLSVRNRILSKHLSEIIVAGHKLSSEQKNKIPAKILTIQKNKTNKFKNALRVSKNKKIVKKRQMTVKGYNHISLCFPSYSAQDNLSLKYALAFLASKAREELTSSLGNLGIYHIEFEHLSETTFGLVRFFSYVPVKQNLNKYQSVFYKTIEEILGDEITLKKDLEIFKKKKAASMKEGWLKNRTRLEWGIEDMSELGTVVPISKHIYELRKVDVKLIKSVTKKIFDRKKQLLLQIKSD